MLQDVPRPGLWKRLLIGGFLIVFAAAGATAGAAFHEGDKIVDAFDQTPGLGRGEPPHAGATAVAAFHEVDKIVDAFDQTPELKLGEHTLAETDPGKPQTLLILGSDRRPRENAEGASGARSDTIMLVRLNPDKEATAIMS